MRTQARLLIVVSMLLAGTSAAAQSVGPVASYAFSEATGTMTADVSGNGNAGTLIVPSLWTTDGRYGNGVLLGGGLQGVHVASAAALNVTSAITIEAWIYATSIAGYPKVVWRDGATGTPYSLGLASGNGTVAFTVITSAGRFDAYGYTAVGANLWTHVAATYDGASMRVYVNGLLVGSASASGTIVESTRDLWLGRSAYGEGLTGRLDEVRIYGRALSAVEIARDRDTQVNGLDPPDVGDVWPLPAGMGIAPTSSVRATFSKPMDAASVTAASFYLTGPSGVVAAAVAYDPDTQVATLTPAAPLARITTYTAHITTDVGDLDEGSLRAPVAWTFTTSPDPALAHAAFAFSEGNGSTAADSSANGNTATLTRATLWTTTGEVGNALALGGGTDGARIPAAPSLEMSQGLTLEAWIYPTSIANYPKLIWRDGVNNASPYNLGMAWGNGSVGLSIATTNGNYTVWAFRAIVVNTWTHVAATYDGSLMRIFINGQFANAVAASGSIISSIRDLWLGRAPWGEGFTGTLDEVRIYGRALTASEIANDMGTPATDITPPTVLSAVPQNRQSAVDPAANILATFDEALAAATVNDSTFDLRDSAGVPVPASVSYDASARSAVLDPVARLSDVTTYTATLRTGVTNAAAISLQNEFSWTFTTADTTPPSVVGVAPASAARNVSLASDVRITFSEPLDPASVSSDTIQLRDTRGVLVPGTVSYDAQSKVATFVPLAALLPTRPYNAMVVGGASGARIKDVAGNALDTSYTWMFITTVERARIAAGTTHSVALDDSGQVWTWGSGSQQRGQALDGRIPGAVPGASGAVSIAAGNGHTLALEADGTLLAWGTNTEGQLGIGNLTAQSTPVAVSGLTNVIAVAAGAASSVALKADGTVWTWGAAHQIGDGQNTRRLTPVQVPALGDAIAIAAGDVADYVLKADGTVWSWGDNTNGQIGDGTGGTGVTRLSPVLIASLAGVVAIAGGAQHALAIVGSNLSLRAWGLNSSGQIGDGTTGTQRYTPTVVSGLVDVRGVDGAGNRSIAALLDGTVKVWGSAVTATGTGSLLPIGAPGNPLAAQVTGNTNHLMSATSTGTVWTWGLNASSQLGDGTTTDRRTADTISADSYSWKVGVPTVSVAAATYSQVQNVIVTTATSAAVIHYTLDGNDPTENDPQVPGTGVVVVDRTLTLKAAAWKSGSPPSSVASVAYVLQVAQPAFSPNGGTFSAPTTVTISTTSPAAVIHYTTDGSTPTASSPLYTASVDIGTTSTLKAIATRAGWSDSSLRSATFTMNFGTLTAPTLTPAPGTYESRVVVSMAAQELSTIRYTTNGSTPTATSTVYDGPLTLNATTTLKAKAFRTDYATSAETSGTYTIVAPAPVISLASGTYARGATFAITDIDPSVTIRVTFNGLDPTSSDGSIPSGTTLLVGSFQMKARAFKTGVSSSAVASATFALTQPFGAGSISAGGTHTLLATPAGLVYAWGLGTAGQLGNGGNSNKTTPTVVPTLTGVVSISGGSSHTLAAMWDGRVFAWGSNASGRLGDGTTTSSLVPIEIAGLQNVVSVAAGGSHSLALTSDGHVYAWGVGNSGQLGLGTFASSLTPALIPTLSDIVAISAGGSHSLAVDSAGQLYAWGFNTSSQLGDGGQAAQATPKLIASLTGVSAISAGGSHSLARLSSGDVYSWGDNSNGQLGLGDATVRRVPTRIAGLVATDVVAGGSHSMAVRADGVLVAWGANGSGQIGDTTTIMRTTPVPVSGPGQVAMMAAGTSHSVAVTAGGHVWGWGADGSGQVGDGTTTLSRPTPLDVLTASAAWGTTPSPMLSVLPGAYDATQTVVVTGAAGAAADMHYTLSGAAPTQSDPLILDGASIVVDRSATLKLRAFAAGRLPSPIVSASYLLQPDVPSITPGTATYTIAQSVIISTPSPGATLRYTVDGTDPTASSALYTGPIVIDTFSLLKVKAFRDGWTPSSTATATFTFNYGTLAAPAFAPVGGIYTPGQTATIIARDGEQIRYTLNGSDPDESSAPYVSPIILPDGFVTVKARAFRIDWTASPVASQSYVVTDDTTPPTITASLSPSPNARGWNGGDVDVTFTCDDPSGVTWCTLPTKVTGEGYALPVVASATDVWGNQQSSTFTVNIDRTAPVVHIYDPKDGRHVAPATTSITVRGGAHDLSGIESVSCNGIAAVVVGDAFTCGVDVVAGTNVITVEARDFAGHSASSQVSVTVGDVIVTALDVSPASLTMIAGDTREIVVNDQEGGEHHDGTWLVSDGSVARVADAEGVTTVTALGAGQTTLRVTINGVTAEATVTVWGAGEDIPGGTILWSLSDPSGYGAPKRGYVLRASSNTADDNPEKSPALFFVDEGTEYLNGGTALNRARPTQVRTTTADGHQLSEFSFGGRVPRQIAADNNSGYVIVFPAGDGLSSSMERIDGRNGAITWEYVASSGFLSDVAIHPDGTVYATEAHITDSAYLVAVNSLGQVEKQPLPQGHYTEIAFGLCGKGQSVDTPGYATGPIIREDGTIALVSVTRVSQQYVYTYPDSSTFTGCAERRSVQDYSFTDTAHLVELTPQDANVGSHEIADPRELIPIQFTEETFSLLPDGRGGLLMATRHSPYLIRIDSDYHVTGSVTEAQLMPNDTTEKYETEYVLAEDGVYALVNSRATTQIFPEYTYEFVSNVVQVDPETLTPLILPTQLGDRTPDPQHLRLKFAVAGGGIYVNGPALSYGVNMTTSAAGFAAGGNATHIANGFWTGWNGAPSAVFGAEAIIGQTRWAYAGGLESANSPSPRLLTTTRLRELAAERGIGTGMTGIRLNQQIGLAFQGVAIWSLYQREDSNRFFLESPTRSAATAGAVNNVVPDFLGTYIVGVPPRSAVYPDSVLSEVKAVNGLIGLSYSRHQIRGLIDAASRSPLGVTNTNWPLVEFITTADTVFGFDAIANATSLHVEIRQRLVWELAGGFLRVGPGKSFNGSWWSMFITGRTALPALLPGRNSAPLGTHIGESPEGDPDPPAIEP